MLRFSPVQPVYAVDLAEPLTDFGGMIEPTERQPISAIGQSDVVSQETDWTAAAVDAEPFPTRPLTLSDVLVLLRSSPQMAALRGNISIALAERTQAGMLPNPELRYLRFATVSGDRDAANDPDEWGFTQELLLFGQREAAIRTAAMEITATQAEVFAQYADLAASLAGLHPRIRAAQNREAAARSGMTLARKERLPVPELEMGWWNAQAPTRNHAGALFVGVSVPTLLFDRGQGRISRASAVAIQAAHHRQAVMTEAEAQLQGSIHVRVGDKVEAGDVLVTLISPEAAAARAELAQATAQVRAARTELDRQTRIFETGVGIRRDKFEAEIRLAEAEAALASARLAVAFLGDHPVGSGELAVSTDSASTAGVMGPGGERDRGHHQRASLRHCPCCCLPAGWALDWGRSFCRSWMKAICISLSKCPPASRWRKGRRCCWKSAGGCWSSPRSLPRSPNRDAPRTAPITRGSTWPKSLASCSPRSNGGRG